MAEIVLGISTSHTPLLSLAPELWSTHAQRELAYPPNQPSPARSFAQWH